MYREKKEIIIFCDNCRSILVNTIYKNNSAVYIKNEEYFVIRYFATDMFYKPNNHDDWSASQYRLNEKRGSFISRLSRITKYYCCVNCQLKHETSMLKHRIIKIQIEIDGK
jgi:hypothetical protein